MNVINAAADASGLSSPDPQLIEARKTCWKLSLGNVVFGGLITIFSFGAYFWSIGFAIVAICAGVAGLQHLSSDLNLRHNTCCSSPLSAVKDLYLLNIFICVCSVLSIIAGVVAAILREKTVYKVFGVLLAISCLIEAVISGMYWKRGGQLYELCRQDPGFLAQAAVQMQPVQPVQAYPVAQGQPMYGYPAQSGGYTPSYPQPGYDPNNQPPPQPGYNQHGTV